MEDAFIQKKLLYKFDKKIELLFQSIFQLQSNPAGSQMLDESQQSDKKSKYLTRQAILQEIEQLRFLNFKYRTALISAQKDQASNQAIIKKAESQIIEARAQVDKQSLQLQHELKCKRNKEEYNHLAQSLKQGFEPLSVQNQKLATITREIDEMQRKYQKQVSEHEKKQKCLRLALSALKCVIETDESQQNDTMMGNNILYVAQPPFSNGVDLKVSQPIISQPMSNQGNGSSRQEGEQLEGGEILY